MHLLDVGKFVSLLSLLNVALITEGGVVDIVLVSDNSSNVLTLLRNSELFRDNIEERVDTVLNDMRRQGELEDEGSLGKVQLDHVDVLRVRLLLEEELVPTDVPVGAGLAQGALIDHFSILRPHLEQILVAIVELEDLLVFNFDENRAEVARVVELATRHDFVQLVQGDLVHDPSHEVLGAGRLIVL